MEANIKSDNEIPGGGGGGGEGLKGPGNSGEEGVVCQIMFSDGQIRCRDKPVQKSLLTYCSHFI